jgi:hypothetical protein
MKNLLLVLFAMVWSYVSGFAAYWWFDGKIEVYTFILMTMLCFILFHILDGRNK